MADKDTQQHDDVQQQWWAFGWKSIDEVRQEWELSKIDFSLDMDDIPDLSDLDLSLNPTSDQSADNVVWPIGNVDQSTDDVPVPQLEEISLDDLQIDDLDVSLPKQEANALADVSPSPKTDWVSDELVMSDNLGKVESSSTSDVSPTMDDPVIDENSATDVAEEVVLDDPVSDEIEESPVEDSSQDEATDVSSPVTDESPAAATDDVFVPLVAPTWTSKLVEKFFGVLSSIHELEGMDSDGSSIRLLWTRTEKESVHYVFELQHDQHMTVTKERRSDDMSEDVVLEMMYADEYFATVLDNVKLYMEWSDGSDDKDTAHIIADKLGKFSLLLNEEMNKKREQLEQQRLAEEEKKMKKQLTRKLRDF